MRNHPSGGQDPNFKFVNPTTGEPIDDNRFITSAILNTATTKTYPMRFDGTDRAITLSGTAPIDVSYSINVANGRATLTLANNHGTSFEGGDETATVTLTLAGDATYSQAQCTFDVTDLGENEIANI